MSFTIDGNISGSSPLVLCDDANSLSCSDFNFLHLYYDSSSPKSPYTNVLLYYSFMINGEYYNGQINISPFVSDYYLNFSEYSFDYFRITAQNVTSLIDSDHPVTVDVLSSLPGGSPVSGNLDISSNGTYDVSSYATATVDVPQTSVNPYHDDLVGIRSAILIGCATLLVIYFFYCIYRMIIRGSNVN